MHARIDYITSHHITLHCMHKCRQILQKCILANIHAITYIHALHACMHTYNHACTYAYAHTHTSTYAYKQTCTHTSFQTYTTCIHCITHNHALNSITSHQITSHYITYIAYNTRGVTQIHTCIRTHMHIRINTCMHTCITSTHRYKLHIPSPHYTSHYTTLHCTRTLHQIHTHTCVRTLTYIHTVNTMHTYHH